MPPATAPTTLPGGAGHVIVLDDGDVAVHTAAGELLRAQGAPDDLARALDDPRAASEQTRVFVGRLDDEASALRDAYSEQRWPQERRKVIVTGTGTILDDVTAALAGWGVRPTRLGSTAELHRPPLSEDGASRSREPSLLISYAETPDERREWNAISRASMPGLAWLRVRREHDLCFVEPLTRTAGDAGPEHVRRRRVAASPHPRAAALWARDAPAPTGAPDAFVRASTVSRVLRVALAWAQNDAALSDYRRTLWKLVPATGRVTEHTVLGYEEPYAPGPCGAGS